MSDELSDVIELINFGNILTFGLGEAFASLFPPFVILDGTYEFVTQDIPSSIFTWMINNLNDDDAIAKGKEIFYCALKDTYPDLNQFLLRLGQEAAVQAYSPILSATTDPKKFTWSNFNLLVGQAFSAPDGSIMAYLVVAYLLFLKSASENLGLSDSVTKALAAGYNGASFLSGNDCADFDCAEPEPEWCYEFDFTTGQHNWYFANGFENHLAGQYVGDTGFVSTEYLPSVSAIFIANAFTGNITKFQTIYSGIGTIQFTLYKSNAWILGPDRNPSNTFEGISGVIYNLEWTITTGLFLTIWFPQGGSGATLQKVKIWGTGNNPFGVDNCE